MSLILDGTDGLSDIDGTASTPAIRGTDTNTGIFFPAADQVAIATNGVERVNLGNSATVFNDGGADVDFRVEGDTNQNLLFVDASTDRIGINNSSPDTKLNIGFTGADAVNTFRIEGSNGSSERYAFDIQADGGNTATKFLIGSGGGAPTERMRITSSGNLLVGTTTNIVNADFRLQVSNSVVAAVFRNNPSSATTETVLVQNQQTSGDNKFIIFATDTAGTQRGNIDYNRGAGQVRYNTTSDATLKNLIGDSDKQKSVEILNSTKIREYTWKEDAEQKPQIGVIAQELYETYKGAVVEGGKDANGDYKPWGVDKTAFTFHLIAGWQEHQKLIQELKATVDAQAARIAALEAAV